MRRQFLRGLGRRLNLRRAWSILLPLLPFAGLALVGIVGACLMSSCGGNGTIIPNGHGGAQGGPDTVRVKLTATPGMTRLATSGAYRVYCDGRVMAESKAAMPSLDLSCSGNNWRLGGLSCSGRTLVLEPLAGGCFYVGQTGYRGTLRCISGQSGGFVLVNHVDMESYIAGVLPKELLPSWSLEAYKALAVAARTFAIWHKRNTGTSQEYDLGDSESSQVYGGYSAEYAVPNARRAVDATYGQVLGYRQGLGTQIFMAQYSAACGGVVNSANVVQNSPAVGPLAGGQVCNDCRACPRYRWPAVRVYKRELCQALLARYPQTASLGNVASVNITSATSYGRAVWVDVIGTTGQSLRVRAEDLRLAWNMSLAGKPTASTRRLYSMNCSIRSNADSFDFYNGHGFGHGVGLCQWGAQAKSAGGWTANQILSFYYPGASIMHAY